MRENYFCCVAKNCLNYVAYGELTNSCPLFSFYVLPAKKELCLTLPEQIDAAQRTQVGCLAWKKPFPDFDFQAKCGVKIVDEDAEVTQSPASSSAAAGSSSAAAAATDKASSASGAAATSSGKASQAVTSSSAAAAQTSGAASDASKTSAASGKPAASSSGASTAATTDAKAAGSRMTASAAALLGLGAIAVMVL